MGDIDDLRNIIDSVEIGLTFYCAILWRPSIILCKDHFSSRFRAAIVSEKEDDRAFQWECIVVYKTLPALWKVKCDDYSNRQKKNAAYGTSVEKFREKYTNYIRKGQEQNMSRCQSESRIMQQARILLF